MAFKGRNTLAQTLHVWNVWGDSDRFGNKSVRCVQLCWKLLEPHRRWLVVRGLDAFGYSDWLCASCSMTILIGSCQTNTEPVMGVLCFSLIIYGLHSVPSFPVSRFWITGTSLPPPDVNTYCYLRKRRESTHYCVVGRSRGGMFQFNFSAEQIRREATEWLDKGRWSLVWVWPVCGPLNSDASILCYSSNQTNSFKPK